MSRLDSQLALMPSLVDRLVDAGVRGSSSPTWYTPAQMIEAVQRDLEELLNTRETHQGLFSGMPQVQDSLMTYGLPDLASLSAATTHQREEIGRAIEAVVTRFEPRLHSVRASLLNGGDSKTRTVRFRIEGQLRMDPAPDVAFDTTLELATGRYSVKAT